MRLSETYQTAQFHFFLKQGCGSGYDPREKKVPLQSDFESGSGVDMSKNLNEVMLKYPCAKTTLEYLTERKI